jgi:hypothetical protein
LSNISFREGRAEQIPALSGQFDAVLASLSLMYVIDGMRARVEIQTTEFSFEDFPSAWEVLAGVTTAQLPAERQEEAKVAVRAKMWPDGDGPRHFINETGVVIGTR